MAELSHWKTLVVPQKYLLSGCIPTGFEWLVRYQNYTNVRSELFQEFFDLERLGLCKNSFANVVERIKMVYPNLDIKHMGFIEAKLKITVIQYLTRVDIPCLLSLAKSGGGYHIVPVVYANDNIIKVIWSADKTGNQIREYSLELIEYLHTHVSGGKDIAWI